MLDHHKINHFFHIYFRFPYVHEKSPNGYLFMSLFNLVSVYYIVMILTCILCTHFGLCILLMAFSIDIKQNLHKIEKKLKTSISQQRQLLSMTEVNEIKKNFCDIVQFHGVVRQLSETTKISNSIYCGVKISFFFHISILTFSLRRMVQQCSIAFMEVVNIIFLLSTSVLCVLLIQIQRVFNSFLYCKLYIVNRMMNNPTGHEN